MLGALLANLRIIPPASAGGAPYDQVFADIVPAGIFLLLLDVNLRAIRRAGAPMLVAFALGAVGVMLGVALAATVLPTAPLGQFGGPLAGMFTGTYIGGSANFNAVATAYGVEAEGGIYLAAVVADNVMTVLWMLLLLAAPRLLRAAGLFRATGKSPVNSVPDQPDEPRTARPFEGIAAVAYPLAATGLGLAASFALADILANVGIGVPAILIVTTLALLLAQTRVAARMALAPPLGMWALYLFLAVVGATADIEALVEAQGLGLLLFGYIAIIFAVHGLVMILGALLFKLDPETLSVASVANIGGRPVAPAIAEGVGREDLAVPGKIAGALGTAIGTYAGFVMAELLLSF